MEILITSRTEEVLQYVRQLGNQPVVCDIETTSLVISKGRILCIGLGGADTDEVLVWWPREAYDVASLRLSRAVFHNAYFDQRWLQAYGAKIHTTWDTMLMAHLLDENHSVGLKSLGQRLLGYADWSEDEVADLENVPKAQVSQYVAKDVHVTRELLKLQRRRVHPSKLPPQADPVRVMRKIMIPAIPALTTMEDNRIPIDLNQIAKERKRVEGEIHRIEQKLDRSVPPKDRWPDWLQRTQPKWGNTNWTKWWLFVYQGAPVVDVGKPTKTWPDGNPSVSQKALGQMAHPAAKLLSRRSTLYKTLTGFLVPLTERAVDGRVSTSYRLTGTVTGRLSSSSPGDDNPGINSQQIPRDKATRNLFGAKGLAWIEADYSQLELRVAAVMAGENTMLQLFKDGVDIHRFMAERLVPGKEITKEIRSLAKGVNFGFLYGMHSTHFANYVQENYGVTINREDADKFREEYFKTFSQLPEWYRRQREFALEHGGVPNAFGRFRHLPRVYNDDYWVQENAFRQAINSPVQSTGSDFLLLSLSKIHKDQQIHEWGAKMVATVHDSVCLTAPYPTARKVAKRVKEIMEMADQGLDQKYFLRADVTISRVWGGEPLAEY